MNDLQRMWKKLQTTVSRFRKERDGVGAVEFALIAPVLIVLYVGSLETSVAMSVNKKISRASSSIADLVTQQTAVDKNFLKTMIDVAESVIAPFGINDLKIAVTGINIDASGNPKVAWSWNEAKGQPYAPGTAVTVPSQLKIASTFLVRTEVTMNHELMLILPGLKGVDAKTLKMSKTYHLRQRIGDSVTCSNCGPAT